MTDLSWVSLAAIGLVAYVVLDAAWERYQTWARGCKPFASSQSDWLFGFALLFRSLRMKREGHMVDYIYERFNTFELDTMNFRIAGIKVISTQDPENIKALLGTQFNDFVLGDRHAHFQPLLGEGIFTLDGEGWKHSRAMLRPQFAREQVSHVKALEPHIQLLARHIDTHGGARFDIQELFFRLTVDSATEFLFGESVASLQDEQIGLAAEMHAVDFDGKKGFAAAFNGAQAVLSSRSIAQKLYWVVDGAQFRQQCAHVHRFADYYVQKALSASPLELEQKLKDGYIFLYELVKETRNPKILRDQLLNILLAGRDTTAGLLLFTMFELARNPQIWAQLQREISDAFGVGDAARVDEISFETLKLCQYLKAILNETLRLYPSVPQNFRLAAKNTTLPRGGGKDGLAPLFIRKGATITYAVLSMQRLAKHYGPDALVFRPERWLTGETKKLGWAYLPFNGGPRICLGQQFALTEASYVIARLVQLYPRLVSFDPEYPPKKMSHLTMCHQNGVFIGLAK